MSRKSLQSLDWPHALSTRLAHPLLPAWLVTRERLLSRLDAALSHRLTLVSASAGWGKTTLLSTWATRSNVALAWLSLDELDNEPTRFWVSVLLALRTCLPGVGETALAMLRSPQPSLLTKMVLTLLHELSEVTQPLVLLIDDYHVIEDQAIHDSLLFLLERLPAHFHLLLASRIDPPLALARLRVHGQLLELRDSDLRFHDEEATQFFGEGIGISLSPQEVEQLTQRTEGWIAGLQLAALSMQQREEYAAFIQSFTGSHRHVLDYVQEEILLRLPAALQDFLPQIAILNKISAPLCQAVTGEVESRALLEQAERANLFLIPLDEERRWYRLHDLFREALLTRLHTVQPELVALLHQRAAHYYENQREWCEAIFHYLEASDFWSAAHLMEQALEELWLEGSSQVFFAWVMALPAEVIRKYARFALNAALYTLNSAAYQEIARARTTVEGMIRRVEEAVFFFQASQESPEGVLPVEELALLKQRIFLLRLWGETIQGIISGEAETHQRAMRGIEEAKVEDDILWQMVPLSIRFLVCWSVQSEGTSLLPIFEEAWERARRSGNRFALFKVQQWVAAVRLRAGKLRLVYQECQSTLDLLAQLRGFSLLGGYISFWLACVLYEWNRLDEAREVVRKMLHSAKIGQQYDLQGVGYDLWLDIELAADDKVAAQQVMQQATTLFRETSWEPELLSYIQVTYWLGTGDLAQAANFAAHTTPGNEYRIVYSRRKALLLARISLALQQYRAALDTLQQYREHLDQTEDLAALTSFLARSVVALHQLGEREAAQTTLIRLLTLTEQEGFMRVYLNAGLPMQEALQAVLNAGEAVSMRAYVSQLLLAFAQEERRHELTSDTPSDILQTPEGAVSAPAFLEPLTSQEQRVLRLLVAGHSNQEIARLLVISLNTVKTHIKNLYSKLQVKSRTQAIALARALRLF